MQGCRKALEESKANDEDVSDVDNIKEDKEKNIS